MQHFGKNVPDSTPGSQSGAEGQFSSRQVGNPTHLYDQDSIRNPGNNGCRRCDVVVAAAILAQCRVQPGLPPDPHFAHGETS